jgi:hypothetical protein
MQKKQSILLVLAGVFTLGFTACLKTPGTPEIKAGKSTVAVNEPVTFTIKSIDHFTCIQWASTSTGGTTINGGGDKDLTWSVSFSTPGTKQIVVTAKNCKNNCEGTCKESTAETSITVN